MANKNSLYVQSLVSFILDTKPYHSKLTQIVEEYQFYDSMNVSFEERTFKSTDTKAAWLYSHFANGSNAQSTRIHALTNPLFRPFAINSDQPNSRGAFKTGRDENTDLPNVPYAYDPKSIQGTGISDAFVQRANMVKEPLLEGHDFFQSHGAYSFLIDQTISSLAIVTGRYSREFTAADAPFPVLVNLPFDSDTLIIKGAAVQVTTSQISVTGPSLIEVTGLSSEPNIDPTFIEKVNMSAGGPATRESGKLNYKNLSTDTLIIQNITCDPTRSSYEEFTLVAANALTLMVYGSQSGKIGQFNLPPSPAVVSFVTTQVSFEVTRGVQNFVAGDTFTLTPASVITIHPTADLETWSLIKTNPISYSRPVFTSTRYGYIVDQVGTADLITVVDTTMPGGSIVLTAVSPSVFSLTHSEDVLYTGTVQVNVPYNDGKLAFTIVGGSVYSFKVGDKFVFELTNELARAEDLDLYYGFDMDPFDGNNLVYNNDPLDSALPDYLRTLDFGFDSRFENYDLSAFNLVVTEDSQNNRKWRLRAISNGVDLKLGNYTPTGQVNLLATDDPTNPDALAIYDTPDDVLPGRPETATDPDLIDDLRLFGSNTFDLEYFDEDTRQWVFVANVPVGSSYSSAVHGISFNLIQASKPFIAAELNTSWVTTDNVVHTATVLGGDVISWTIRNSPTQLSSEVSFVSANTPRLIMHGRSYYDTVPGKWTLSWTNAAQYTLTGVYTSGPSLGLPFYTGTVNLADGQSYKNDAYGLHFTVVNGDYGYAAGDSFTFTTFERKPSYLVHGSVSGWQPDAVIGEWYWNGKIGFKIEAATIDCFYAGDLVPTPWNIPGVGTIILDSLRRDAPSATYVLRSHVDGYWMLYRNGQVVGGGDIVVSDEYLKLLTPPAVAGTEVIFSVESDEEHLLSIGHDLGIVRTSTARLPETDDFVLFERTAAEKICISIKPRDPDHAVTLTDLAPVNIDLRFVDHEVDTGVALAATSPETAVLEGWIPALYSLYDSTTSFANFKDPATTVVVTAAATGETIGTVRSIGVGNEVEPVIFQWDPDFALKYLPLNTEASLVTYGGGMNEEVLVYMTDSVRFSTQGALGEDNALFTETIGVGLNEGLGWAAEFGRAGDKTITVPVVDQTGAFDVLVPKTGAFEWQPNAITVQIEDGPFGGFLPGFDGLPFDAEAGVDGYFDAGQALLGHFEEAKALAALSSLSATEQARLNDLIAVTNSYLNGGDLAATTMEYFTAALAADDSINYTPTASFGIPYLGMGMDMTNKQTTTATASTEEAMTIMLVDDYGFDKSGLDVDEFDTEREIAALVYASGFVLPNPNPNTVGMTYEELDTPLYVSGARIIDFVFQTDIGINTPQVQVWYPDQPQPISVVVAQKLDERTLRIMQPTAREAKFIIS